MRFLGIALLVIFVSGCVQPGAVNRIQRAESSEAYVDLRQFVFDGRYTSYNSTEDLISKIKSMDGGQREFETNSEYSARMSGFGLSAVMSNIKDYQVKFDKSTGALNFVQAMDEAQLLGFKIGGRDIPDYRSNYYSIMLPEVSNKKGEFAGQNSFGAKAVIDQVEIDRVILVSPPIPKQSVGIMYVDLIVGLKLTAAEYQSQKDDLRLAVIFEPIPDYLQSQTNYGTATIANKRQATVHHYFLSSKLGAVSVVNVKSKQIVSDVARIRFKTP